RLTALQDTIEAVGRDRLPKLRDLGEMNLTIARIRSISMRVALAEGAEQRSAAEALLQRRVTSLNQKIEAFKAGIPENSALKLMFDQFANKWA
ncbi:hypothetical protein ABTD16_19380, partial [Acinetobacter baumannii]